uniref:Uncharacterized protein n=1 Tax=Candidozyma auris TaxID=498019 RepID=A0A0L0P7U7_CANAR
MAGICFFDEKCNSLRAGGRLNTTIVKVVYETVLKNHKKIKKKKKKEKDFRLFEIL